MFDSLSSILSPAENAGAVASDGSRVRPPNGLKRSNRSDRSVAHTPPSGIAYTLTEQRQDSRLAAEGFIRKRYAAAYGATLTSFMPRLFSLHTVQGEMVAALGLRPANRTLFLERYLDHPIEAVIGNALGISIERQQIIEVGHFAGAGVGTARAMIMQLTSSLFHEGFRWVVFTGTVGLRNAFYRLGLNPLDLAPADPMRLDQHEQLQWGSYYQGMPRVQFGDIAEGFAALRYATPLAKHPAWKAQP